MFDDVSRRKFLEVLGVGAFASALESSEKTLGLVRSFESSRELVAKTSVQVDIDRLRAELFAVIRQVGWHPDHNQIGFTHRLGCRPEDEYWDSTGALYDYEKECFISREKDFAVFNKDLEGSYLHEIVKGLPFQAARVRLMRLAPKKCLSMHEDTGPRYHLALKTNPDAYLFYQDNMAAFRIPQDGALYRIDATKHYTEFNSNRSEERIHLVITDSKES